MAGRKRFRDEMSALLGMYFSDTDHVLIGDPRAMGRIPEEYVVMHEGIHRLLVHGTMMGAFERCAVSSLRRAERVGDGELAEMLQAALTRIVADTFVTHEAAACYVELCNCAEDAMGAEAYLQTFPPELADAVARLIAVLYLPESFSLFKPYQWLAGVFLAKLALNSPVLQEFADPAAFTLERFEAFERTEAPDARFARLCSGLAERGGVGWVIPAMSERMTESWTRLLDVPPAFHEVKGLRILDLRRIGGMRQQAANLVAEHAEHAMMRAIAALCAPELRVVIGNEEMEAAASPFVRAWTDYPPDASEPPPRVPAVLVTPPGDDRVRMHTRGYATRFRIEPPGRAVELDELRGFLSRQAAAGRTTLAGFLETVDGEPAVFAASFERFDRTRWECVAELRPVETLVAGIDLRQVLDLAQLYSETEPYTACTGWHLPLEVAHRLGFPSVGPFLHGTLLRSWAVSPDATVTVAKNCAERGRRVHVHVFNWAESNASHWVVDVDHARINIIDHGSKAIVLEIFDDDADWLERLPRSPSYIAWLGTAPDMAEVRSGLKGVANVSWEAKPGGRDPGMVRALLEVAYDLERFLGSVIPGLVRVDDPQTGPG